MYLFTSTLLQGTTKFPNMSQNLHPWKMKVMAQICWRCLHCQWLFSTNWERFQNCWSQRLFLKQMEIATVLLCISVHFQEQECIGCTMCTSIKFLHICVTWEAHCFRGRRIASVKIKTSQVMLGKCMIFHYWTGVPWRCQSLRYDPSYFVAMIFAWYCGTCFCGRVITQLAG